MQPHTIPLPLPFPHRLLPVAGGTFIMGNKGKKGDTQYDDKPTHEVTLDGCYLGEYAVTQALWQAVMGDNPANNKSERHPVESVSWFDAAVFCNRLSVATDRKPCYTTPNGTVYGLAQRHNGQHLTCYTTPNGTVYGLKSANNWYLPNDGEIHCDFEANGYRLPTEAEWEYAVRGGSDYEYGGAYAGGDLLDQLGWYRDNSDNHTHEVGLLLPNSLGLYDMSGNVWEWCYDWYEDYSAKPSKNPRGAKTGTYRVLRGSSFFNGSWDCRSVCRFNFRLDHRNDYFGFRLVLQSIS